MSHAYNAKTKYDISDQTPGNHGSVGFLSLIYSLLVLKEYTINHMCYLNALQ